MCLHVTWTKEKGSERTGEPAGAEVGRWRPAEVRLIELCS